MKWFSVTADYRPVKHVVTSHIHFLRIMGSATRTWGGTIP